MALREDYFSPCASEINRKIRIVESIQEDIINTKNNLGLKNSISEEDLKNKLKRLDTLLEDVRDLLYFEKNKLADTVSDL